MRAIILAAGLGLRLQQPPEAQFPKCLLRFDDVAARAPSARTRCRGRRRDRALGFQHEKVEQELKRLGRQAEIVINDRYDLGSVLTVHTVADAMTRGGDVLLMDADVLYDENILHALVADSDKAVDRLLIDRDFEAGDGSSSCA